MMSSEGPPPKVLPGVVRRAVSMVERRRRPGSGSSRTLVVLSAVGLALGIAVSLRNLPSTDQQPSFGLLLLAACLASVSFVVNGVEYLLIARWSGAPTTIGHSVEVSLMASAANALPIPGAALVKVQAMRTTGATGRRAVLLVTFAAAVLLSVALIAAGGLGVVSRDAGLVLAIGAVVGGGIGLAVAGVMASAAVGRARVPVVLTAMTAVESLSVLLMGIRTLLVFAGLGYDVGLAEAFAVSLAGVLSTLVGIVPGGLGVREGIAALLGRLVGTGAATSLVVTAVDRLIAYVVLMVMAGPVLLIRRRRLRSRIDEPDIMLPVLHDGA